MKVFSALVALVSVAASLVDAYPLTKRAGGNPKFVVAHHMVGNTSPYSQSDWASDIQAAHAAGIDGFALNIGSDSWQSSQVASAYAAAQASGTGFKLFISFDMSSLPCASPADAAALRQYITTYADHPNQLKYNGNSFVSTFSGETCRFGQGSVAEGWKSQFSEQLTGQNAVHFVPSFFIDPATFGQYSGIIDGAFNWNSGWPTSVTTDFAAGILGSVGASWSSAASTIINALAQYVGVTDTDSQWVNGLKSLGGTYIGAVSPWFFTHYGPDTYNKNWIYYSGSHLYNTRWERIIQNRDIFDIVEIITWNDFGESHYIGPIHGAQPNSQSWVDGFEHAAWLDMTQYYASAYKSGSYPAITQDKLYMWARPHPANANAPDPVAKPTNWQTAEDVLWAVVFATAPGSVTFHTSDSAAQTFAVKAGVNKFSVPLTPGGYLRGTLTRNGNTVIDFRPEGYTFNANPQTYNYNAFTAFASSGTDNDSAPVGPASDPVPTASVSGLSAQPSSTVAPKPVVGQPTFEDDS